MTRNDTAGIKALTIEFVSVSITQPIARVMKKISSLNPEFLLADINQHIQKLHSGSSADVLILQTRADYFLREGDDESVNRAVDNYIELIEKFVATNRPLVIVNTVEYNQSHFVGHDNLRGMLLVSDINRKLIESGIRSRKIAVADVAGAVYRVGLTAANSIQNDLVMQMPYKQAAIDEIAREYDRVIRQHFLPRKKMVILDADNTLWGGIVGEDGITGIQVDHNFPGIVYRKFQQQLSSLRASGVLLGLVSKNNESDVLELFASIDMPLKWDDFAARRVNWSPKSTNIESIAEEINIGLDAVIFIDDNPFELNEVRHSLPMVDCYPFDGKSADSALNLLASCAGLTTWAVTEEDRRKSDQYKEEAERKSLRAGTGSVDDYIRTLGIKIQVGINRHDQIARISQLTNKTNQFNLTTRRYSAAQIEELMDSQTVLDFRVADRYGDLGIVGVIILRDQEIDTFLMSCRALGREIEANMLAVAIELSGSRQLRASFVPTSKNSMVADFYDRHGFELISSDGAGKNYIVGAGPSLKFEFEIERISGGKP